MLCKLYIRVLGLPDLSPSIGCQDSNKIAFWGDRFNPQTKTQAVVKKCKSSLIIYKYKLNRTNPIQKSKQIQQLIKKNIILG